MADENADAQAAAGDTTADAKAAETPAAAPTEAVATKATTEPAKTDKVRDASGKFTPQQQPIWRDQITDAEARKLAETSTDLNHFAGRMLDMRRQLSKAIIPPGKDATPEEVAAYEKKIGVPESYTWTAPEGRQFTEQDLALQKRAGEAFKTAKFTGDQQKVVETLWNEIRTEAVKAQQKAIDDGMVAMEAELRKEWPGQEYETNTRIASQTWARFGGSEALENLKLENGTRLGDHPEMLKIMASIGRATMETAGMLGMSETAAKDLQQQHQEAIQKSYSASQRGDRSEAQRWARIGDDLAAKLWGTAPGHAA
jgi:hypothetical protein